MRKLSPIYFLLIGLLGAASIQDFTLIIYPEYYNTSVMVEVSGTVDTDDLPLMFGMAIPEETDSIFFVDGKTGEETNYRRLDAVQREGETWVFFPVKQPFFRGVLFYTPFEPKGPRAVDFVFKTNQDLRNFFILVQKPAEAENFIWSETDLNSGEDEHGILFFQKHLHELGAEQEQVISLTYDNPSGLTTMASLTQKLGSQNEDNPFAQKVPLRHRLPLWQPLVVLGGLAFALGVLFYRSQRSPGQKPSGNNCLACGGKLIPEAKFCSDCGAPV